MNWRIPKASTLSLNCVSAIYLLIKLNLFVKRRTINFKIKTMLIAEKRVKFAHCLGKAVAGRWRVQERCTKYCSSFAFVLNVREFIIMLWKLFSTYSRICFPIIIIITLTSLFIFRNWSCKFHWHLGMRSRGSGNSYPSF